MSWLHSDKWGRTFKALWALWITVNIFVTKDGILNQQNINSYKISHLSQRPTVHFSEAPLINLLLIVLDHVWAPILRTQGGMKSSYLISTAKNKVLCSNLDPNLPPLHTIHLVCTCHNLGSRGWDTITQLGLVSVWMVGDLGWQSALFY